MDFVIADSSSTVFKSFIEVLCNLVTPCLVVLVDKFLEFSEGVCFVLEVLFEEINGRIRQLEPCLVSRWSFSQMLNQMQRQSVKRFGVGLELLEMAQILF